MSEDYFLVDEKGYVATFIINRPEKRNALNPEIHAGLVSNIDRMADAPTGRHYRSTVVGIVAARSDEEISGCRSCLDSREAERREDERQHSHSMKTRQHGPPTLLGDQG